jgi:structural maintenance of chromosome 4
VRPKNKTWKPLSKLSGGEKTLSSLSLLLSMHFYRPNSFYFFDEIDAALDYKNVGIVARYIKSHTHATQFSVISLRNSMFEEADKLVPTHYIP